MIKLEPRYVKQDDKIRPFQKELLDLLQRNAPEIITLNAPVGSGKSFIIRKLLETNIFRERPMIFTYPTKILMMAQIESIRKELGTYNKVNVWPYENFSPQSTNLFLYSTDALVEYAKKADFAKIKDRGRLLNRLLFSLALNSKSGAIITSPDVLYLLMKGRYTYSKRILNSLQNALFVFDEFHCYYGLEGFNQLIDFILNTIASQVVLMSATPLESDSIKQIKDTYSSHHIGFGDSEGGKGDVCFNYPLDVDIASYKISNRLLTKEKLKELIPELPKPMAIIFDSVFRLRHISRDLIKAFPDISFIEWSGMKKDQAVNIDSNTVILGTSSIEVGLDMVFKSLVFEATFWPSVIQRLGRCGRKVKGNVIILTRKDFHPFIKEKISWDRTEFEQDVIQNVLKNPRQEMGGEGTFRGRSFNFILFDQDLKRFFIYNERLFSMYDVIDVENEWYGKDEYKKKEILLSIYNSSRNNDQLLLHERINPSWGVIEGRIKDEFYSFGSEDIIFEDNYLSILGIFEFWRD